MATPDEIREAVRRFQAELTASAEAINAVLNNFGAEQRLAHADEYARICIGYVDTDGRGVPREHRNARPCGHVLMDPTDEFDSYYCEGCGRSWEPRYVVAVRTPFDPTEQNWA